MNLREAIMYIDDNLTDEARTQFAEMPRGDLIAWHHGFGTWIRNNCGLWSEGGTIEIVVDLKKLIQEGYRIEEIETGKWTFSDLPTGETTDNRVAHPDQSSTAIMYVLHDWLNGNLRRYDLKPMKYRRIEKIL